MSRSKADERQLGRRVERDQRAALLHERLQRGHALLPDPARVFRRQRAGLVPVDDLLGRLVGQHDRRRSGRGACPPGCPGRGPSGSRHPPPSRRRSGSSLRPWRRPRTGTARRAARAGAGAGGSAATGAAITPSSRAAASTARRARVAGTRSAPAGKRRPWSHERPRWPSARARSRAAADPARPGRRSCGPGPATGRARAPRAPAPRAPPPRARARPRRAAAPSTTSTPRSSGSVCAVTSYGRTGGPPLYSRRSG